ADQGEHSGRRGDDPRSRRRRRSLCRDRDLRELSRQIAGAAASAGLRRPEGPDGRHPARAGAADRRAAGLDVVPQEVVPCQAEAAYGWLTFEASMGSVPVVTVDPGRECVTTLT